MRPLEPDDCPNPEWKKSLVDPVREEFLRQGKKFDLDSIRNLFPPVTGKPAFDPTVIQGNAERLKTTPDVNTGHPYLDLSVKTGLAYIDATFQGDHPKYGVGEYGQVKLNGIAQRLVTVRREAETDDGLLVGVPENDEKNKPGRYFHNNGWVAKGLMKWADLCERKNFTPTTSPSELRDIGRDLTNDTLEAIHKTWPSDPADWWLPPKVEPMDRPKHLMETRDAWYTNYRYWPELLSSEILSEEMANRVVDARLTGGGQFCGMTRFRDWLDDWALAEYLFGIWRLGRKDDFLLSLYGHVCYHQAEGHLTAYEQVKFPPGKEKASYCLPCQLVAARAVQLLMNQET